MDALELLAHPVRLRIVHAMRGDRTLTTAELSARLPPDRATITSESGAAPSPDDYWRVFATALAVLTAEFRAYLDREDADPPADLVGFRQHAIWLSREELEQLITELRQAIAPRLANQPTPDRARYLLSPILFPMEQPPATTRHE